MSQGDASSDRCSRRSTRLEMSPPTSKHLSGRVSRPSGRRAGAARRLTLRKGSHRSGDLMRPGFALLSLMLIALVPAAAPAESTGQVRLVPHRAVYDLSLGGTSGGSRESGQRTLDVRTATFESGDGRTIRFKTDSRLEGISGDNVDGEAELRSDGLSVRLKEPRRETLALPG